VDRFYFTASGVISMHDPVNRSAPDEAIVIHRHREQAIRGDRSGYQVQRQASDFGCVWRDADEEKDGEDQGPEAAHCSKHRMRKSVRELRPPPPLPAFSEEAARLSPVRCDR